MKRKYVSLRPTTIGNMIELVKGFSTPREEINKEDLKNVCKDDTRLMAIKLQLIKNAGTDAWRLTNWGTLLHNSTKDIRFTRKIIFMLMYKFLPQFKYMVSLETSDSFTRLELERIGIDSIDSYLLTEKWGREFGVLEKLDHKFRLKKDEISRLFGTQYIPSNLFVDIFIEEYLILKEETKIRFVPYPKLREKLCIRLLIHQNYKYNIDQVIHEIAMKYPYAFRFAAGDQEKTGIGLKGDRRKIHIAIDVKKLEVKNGRNWKENRRNP